MNRIKSKKSEKLPDFGRAVLDEIERRNIDLYNIVRFMTICPCAPQAS